MTVSPVGVTPDALVDLAEQIEARAKAMPDTQSVSALTGWVMREQGLAEAAQVVREYADALAVSTGTTEGDGAAGSGPVATPADETEVSGIPARADREIGLSSPPSGEVGNGSIVLPPNPFGTAVERNEASR